MRGSGRQASPAAAAQAAGTREKFVKEAERKGEEGSRQAAADTWHGRAASPAACLRWHLESGLVLSKSSCLASSLPPLQCAEVRLR